MSDSYEQALQAATDLHQTGHLDDAANQYAELNHRKPDDMRLKYLRGTLELQRGNLLEAAGFLEAYTGKNPDHMEARSLLVNTYLKLGMPGQAVDCLMGYVTKNPQDPRGHYELGSCRLDLGEKEPAAQEFQRFLEAAGNHPEAYVGVGLAHHSREQLDEAARYYRRALEIDTNTLLARQNLAAIHQAQGDGATAEQLYEEVLRQDPDNAQVNQNLGTLKKAQGDLDLALNHYRRAMQAGREIYEEPLGDVLRFNPQARQISVHSLKLQAEQIEMLIERRLLDENYNEVLTHYRDVISQLEAAPTRSHRCELTDAQFQKIGAVMNRLIHLGPTDAPSENVLNPDLNFADIEKRYQATTPGLVVIDEFLTPEALETLRAYCLESTIWFDFTKSGGYCGSYLQEGFGNDLLLQLISELRAALPKVLGPHELNQMWGYIYDSTLSGITAHADQAAVNLNFWITPNEANLDPDSGGLIVYTREAPADWDFNEYNSRPKEIEAFARDCPKELIPYRYNRAVMFHSNLIHKTDDFRFKPGLRNRRINITILFGERSNGE